MSSGVLNIKPYFGGTFDPFSRSLMFVAALALTAGFVWQAFAEIPGLALRCAVCFLGLVFDCAVFFMTFTYTELDEHKIANVFQVGRFFRFEHNIVRWDEVLAAESWISVKPSTANLRVTIKNGTKITFTVSRYSAATDTFDIIAHHFQKHGTAKNA
jgi:hypothetical protein